MRRLGFGVSVVLLAALAVWLAGCDSADEEPAVTLRVFLADSLSRSFGELAKAFEQAESGVELEQIASGSVLAARKLTDTHDQADVIAVADYLVIDKLLRPDYADWFICFATNEIGIAYTQMSVGSAEINEDNWYEVLSRDGVDVQAANPLHDPCGYWTELCWRLADLHYQVPEGASITERMTRKCGPPEDRRSDSQELMRLVETAGGVDYAFCYRSQALQHNVPFLRLPPEINLGSPEHIDLYRRVSIQLPGKEPGTTFTKHGEAIIFAITIPSTVEHRDWAARYIAFALSDEGRGILKDHYLSVVDEPWTYDPDQMPASLRELVAVRERGATTTKGAGGG